MGFVGECQKFFAGEGAGGINKSNCVTVLLFLTQGLSLCVRNTSQTFLVAQTSYSALF